MSERLVLGIKPWLPWPLSRWRWWTEPVRAEYAAALRIAVAAVMLVDLLITYAPVLHTYWGSGSLGDPSFFSYYFRSPRWNWSALHGLARTDKNGVDPLMWDLVVVAWFITTVWVLLGLTARMRPRGPHTEPAHLGWGLGLWIAATVVALVGLWSRLQASGEAIEILTPVSAGLAWIVAGVFLLLALRKRLRSPLEEQAPSILPLAVTAWVVASLLLILGTWQVFQGAIDANDFFSLSWASAPLDGNRVALDLAMGVWFFFTLLMLLGCCTRLSVVVVWVLSVSFVNMNSYNDNAGDEVRNIALFYLMLCPCGAAWSLDGWWARWWGRRDGRLARWLGRPDQPVFIQPWALRLLFIQMALIYCCNGLFKLLGPDWTQGNSLYYVLNDLTLARWSYAAYPIPLWLTRVMTWSVLSFEVGFPLFMLLPWLVSGLLRLQALRSRAIVRAVRLLRYLRVVVLCFGVLFHLGIFASMELGFFGPYMICLYAPLLPWGRWLGRRERQGQVKTAAVGFSTRA
jgi:hypothetical protein